jgi:hypothetical protein
VSVRFLKFCAGSPAGICEEENETAGRNLSSTRRIAMMTPRDVFGLAVRILGLAALMYGVHHVLGALTYRLYDAGSDPGMTGPYVKASAAIAAGWLVFGGCMIAGANTVVNTCYPVPTQQLDAEEQVS